MSQDELHHEDAGRFVILPKYVLLDKRLKGVHRDMYCMLLMYAHQKGVCFPGVGRLSGHLGRDERTCRGDLKHLEDCGLITRKRRPNKTTIYTIKKVEQVYVESVTPWKLKDWYLEGLEGKTPEKEVIEESGVEIRDENGEERAKVEARLAEQRKERNSSMIGAIKDVGERSDRATANAKRNKKLKGKKKASAMDEVVEPVHPSEKPLNCKDVEAVWQETAVKTFGVGMGVDAPWGVMEYGIAKRLIAKFGADMVIRSVEYILKNWEDYMDRFKVSGAPNMKSIAFWSDSWFPEIEMGRQLKPTSNRKKALRQGEFTDDGNEKTVKFL